MKLAHTAYGGMAVWEIFQFHKMYWGGYIPPGFAPMLIEFPKNIGKSSNQSYATDQKTLSILISRAYQEPYISSKAPTPGVLTLDLGFPVRFWGSGLSH